MKDKNRNRAVFAVSLTLVAVMVLLIAVFLSNPNPKEEGIVLPVEQQDHVVEPDLLPDPDYAFVEINRENVLAALQSLSSPDYYHQACTVTVGSERAVTQLTVDMWQNHGLIHAEIRRNGQIKSLISDGQSVWIWYDSDLTPVLYRLDQGITTEDLIGVPALDYLSALKSAEIAETEYLVLEDGTPCIYVCTQEGEVAFRYWISLEHGLLYQADQLENSRQQYKIVQTEFDRLAPGDQMFHGRFCLPDGSEPFTIKREMPQP